MNWEHTLLKKYSATSHIRLIKQLKLELKASAKSNKVKIKNSHVMPIQEKVPFSELHFN